MSLFLEELRKEHAKFMQKQTRQAKVRREDKSMLREEEFHWSDAPKYAKQYYGETFYETTKLDNDWD